MSLSNELSTEEKMRLMIRIGEMLLRLPVTAQLAGHSHTFASAVDYLRVKPNDSKIERLAKQYLIDLGQHVNFRMSLDELIEKWPWVSKQEAVEHI